MTIVTKIAKFKNSVFIGFLNDGVTIAEKYNLKALKLDNEVLKVKTNFSKLNEVYALARKNDNTEIIEELDQKRDRALVGIKSLGEAYLNHYDNKCVTGAQKIIDTFEKYSKRIDKLNYLAETEAVRSLLNDFETDIILKPFVVQLNLTDWLAELKRTNESFNNIYLNRNKEMAELPDQNLKELREPALNDFITLYNKVNAFNTITPSADYAKLLAELNELLIKYNATVPKYKPKVVESVEPPQK